VTDARTQAPDPADSEQTVVRKEKRERLLVAGTQPYPADLSRSHTLAAVRERWGHLEAGEETGDVVTVGGRVVFIRNTGKLAFATLQDGFTPGDNGERLQVMLSLAEVGEQALAAGADEVGSDDLIAKVAGGYTDFDAAVATPDLMGKVGRLGRVLGPRGLMPNPKTGTVTMDVAKAVTDIKGGRIEFRVDRAANLNFIIGKVSFTQEQLTENFQAVLDEVVRLKPSTSKGRYILKATMATTMGPGIPLDVAKA